MQLNLQGVGGSLCLGKQNISLSLYLVMTCVGFDYILRGRVAVVVSVG